jgi:hypothetical protein
VFTFYCATCRGCNNIQLGANYIIYLTKTSMKPMKQIYLFKIIITLSLTFLANQSWSQYQMEKLNRGVVAARSGTNNFVSWRWLGTEDDITFNLYRNGAKVNANPLTVTNYSDNGAAATSQYYVRAIVGGVEQPQSETVGVWGTNYLDIPMQIPAGGTTPSGEAYTYSSSDCSIGDVDGDGIHEIFVKWDPSNSKDNSQSGYTGNVFLDCYKLNGTRLWRIDLGRNIRAGAHYTQFMVYDFDGDGKVEMACKTADATKDGAGTIIGNANADFRSTAGYILTGPEYLTMFNGATGKIMQTVGYIPERGTVSSWGDSYGNRVDRFLAGVAYLDGKKPSLISCRGYYTRTVVVAWDWVNGAFVRRWTFDTNVAGSQYTGNGNHQVSVADVDMDGKHEIIYGAMVIDDNGAILYSTGNGHGDALHVGDLDPTIPGLEVFQIQERDDTEDCYLYSPSQKKVLWSKGTTGGEGPGRGCAANITEQFPGAECWIAGGQVTGAPFQVNGSSMGTAQPTAVNFLSYWDGDLLREVCNGTTIDKYPSGRLLTASGCSSNNGTKSTPSLSGDILGDWREELMVRTSDSKFLRIFTTTTASSFKIRTLLHDAQYRVALAWQNTAYNQPPHPSFYLGAGYALPAKPNITIVGNTTPVNQAPTVSITSPANNASFTAPASITINANAADADGTVSNVQFYNGATLLGSDATSPYSFVWANVAAGTYTLTAKATDNSGAVTTSSTITVVVNAANVAPTVSITSPANNAGFTAPASITINANAADADGTVSNVQFFNGTTLLGSDATSPYSFAWTNVAAGTYTLTARATDNSGAVTTSSAITVVVANPANIAPTVSITSPANNAGFTAPASITINANAADADGTVSNVQFFNGTILLGSDATSPYSFAWTNVAAGTYTLTAMATDNNGAVTTSSAITITVTSPPAGITIQAETACTSDGILNEAVNAGFNGTGYLNLNNAVGSAATWTLNSSASQTVSLSIRYANASATSRNMSLSVNGTIQVATVNFPSTAAWTTWTGATVQVNLAAGRNTIQLTSLIAEGAPNIDELTFGSSSVSAASCTVPNQAPVVNITSPVNNANFIAPASITINATATDADGTVNNVEFYNGNTLLGSDAASPYSFVWNNVAAGTYTLTARATDNSGAVTTSSAVAVTVSAACTPTAITPYVQVNAGAWNQTASVNVNVGDGVILGPQPTTGGSWTWTGPNGFSATTREIALSNIQANQAGNYVATYTNAAGCTSSSTFSLAINNPLPTNVTIQAETACMVDGTLNETFNAGYNGTGYVNTDNFVGASASWAVNSQTAQTVSLSIRYAHTTATGRPMSLSVNGLTQVANIAFGPTASNTTWVVTTVQINLSAGLNTIKMVSTQSIGSPYIDELTFSGVNISAGTCAAAGALPQAIASPNPSSDIFTLTVPEAVQSITVSDMSGIVVYTHGNVGEGETIQFGQNLGSGTFMMTILYTSGRVESKKIQKTL